MKSMHTSGIESTWIRVKLLSGSYADFNSRLTIQPSLAGILTIGLTPQAAIAATASCMALSTRLSASSMKC